MAIAAPAAVKSTSLASSTSQPPKSTTVSSPGNLFLFDSHRRLIIRHRLFSGNSTTPITFQRQISSAASLPSEANVGELDFGENESSSQYIPLFDQRVAYLGEPDGPTCHTGAETCYYLSVSDILRDQQATEHRLASTTLYSLENTISQRRDEAVTNGKPSWTKRLLTDTGLLCAKVREEAEEFVQTLLQEEDRSRTVSEMADLLYHAMVLLSARHVKVEEVFEVLRTRFSQSGIEEKNRRKKNS